MTFKKILCPIDFSLGSQHAMQIAVRIATAMDAELVLAHVWHVPPILFASEFPFPYDTLEVMVQDSEQGLAKASSEATRLGAKRVSVKFLNGVPWHQIVDVLEGDATFDLVVMGTHGRTGLRRVLLGSVTEKVVRNAPCAVLATRAADERTTFGHVLCPIDFSASSGRVISLASALVTPGGAGITLFHAIELPVAYSGDPHIPGFLEGLDRRSSRLLEQWAAELRARVSVPVNTRLRIGTPGAATLAVLDLDPTFDLVVMGSHGRTGIGRVLLGSVAEKVVRHASCSVLVAHARP